MKIGIFGGCFNPPHKMHKTIAQTLINQGYVDKVIFVPTGDTYNKKDLALHLKRVEMLRLMVDNVDMLVSDISKDEQFTYTFEVLDYYKHEYPEATLYFICGTDNLDYFDKWRRYEYILENYKLMVIMRNNDDVQKIMTKYQAFKDSIEMANVEPSILSSTMIRQYIKQEEYGKIYDHIDEKILKYIKEQGLYK